MMHQPLVYDPIVRAWACQQRGLCCRDYDIRVSRLSLSRIFRSLSAVDDPRARLFEGGALERDEAGFLRLPMTEDNACHFLEGRLCGYRGRFGAETLPSPCRIYPYTAILTPRRHLVGLIFTCPTALRLLADEEAVAVVEDPDGEPPTEYVATLVGDHREYRDADGAPLSDEAFWERHWELFCHFRATPGGPLERLADLIARVYEPAPPPLELDREILADARFSDQVVGALFARGGSPFIIPTLLEYERPRPLDEPLPAWEGGDGPLLARYLEHRLLVPTFLEERLDLGYLIAVLLAATVRFRVERAKGMSPLEAIHHLDNLFVQGSFPLRLFGRGPARPDWRTMALLALGGTL